MKISIIVPVYNSEKYLRQCIESILNQTYKNIEVILIDDGSTDDSAQIIDELALKNINVFAFHKINGGLMTAWKYGVEKSTGEYIRFCR